ncbi:hypothetical protein QQ045_031281 [Rhodiola kirilowii]
MDKGCSSNQEEEQVVVKMDSPVHNQVKKINQWFEDTRNPWLKQPEIRHVLGGQRQRSPSLSRLGLSNRPIFEQCRVSPTNFTCGFAPVWRIIKYEHDKHTCEVDIVRIDNVHFNKQFIAMDIKDVIQEDLRYSPKQVMKLMLSKYVYKITYIKAWKALQKAFVYLFGEWEGSFKKLPAYMEMLQESNPGSIVYWDKSTLDSGNVSVNRVFWAFYPAINGFTHCRLVISIDATHLIGKWKGVLMIAVTFDAENGILPIAYALVESENVESWKWFMMCIRNGVTERQGLCIISDRHIGIMRVMKEDEWKPPNAYHHFCDKTDAVKWLEKVNPENWTLAYNIGGRRWGSMTTNQSESFNHVLMPCRDLPITALVHFTFKQVNSYFIERRYRMMGHNKYFVPMIETLNNTNLVKAAHNEVQMYDRSKGIASVLTKLKSRAHEVSVESKTCGCGKWQLFHYPCVHALTVCAQEGLSIRDCVAYEFTTQAYVDTWAQTFNPQPNMTHWNDYVGPKHISNKQFKRVKRGRNLALLGPALVERWRLETHTFHLHNGEMTITLEDVGVLNGLPIEVRAVNIDQEVEDYAPLCE